MATSYLLTYLVMFSVFVFCSPFSPYREEESTCNCQRCILKVKIFANEKSNFQKKGLTKNSKNHGPAILDGQTPIFDVF